ncbi:MAG: lipid A biosynthesis acyltransferase, partial [Flavobacteriaceae bacterium]|nr:lipid A biosynthesis acyltransferase [Flavobacteriaceae bacterium]
MQFLIFVLVYPLIWLLSILPFRVLYFISDIAYYIIYYIVGYRKKTVYHNLNLAFPEKTEGEIKTIAKKSYRHFTDIFVEMIKSFTISEKELSKRYTFKNIDILYKLENEHRSAMLLAAHYGNWEWIFILNTQVKFNGYAIYKKVKNPYFDKKVRQTRGRYGTTLVPTKEIFSLIDENSKKNKLSLYGFLGDQTPKPDKAYYWGEFLGVKNIPIHTGAELLAKKYDLPIVIFTTKKIRRGFYETTFL